MSDSTHDQFTLLYEDEGKRVFCEFQGIFTDEIVREFVHFIRGCGHHDQNIYGAMAQVSSEYFQDKENPWVPVFKDEEELS